MTTTPAERLAEVQADIIEVKAEVERREFELGLATDQLEALRLDEAVLLSAKRAGLKSL